jgi:hypothetical protein
VARFWNHWKATLELEPIDMGVRKEMDMVASKAHMGIPLLVHRRKSFGAWLFCARRRGSAYP